MEAKHFSRSGPCGEIKVGSGGVRQNFVRKPQNSKDDQKIAIRRNRDKRPLHQRGIGMGLMTSMAIATSTMNSVECNTIAQGVLKSYRMKSETRFDPDVFPYVNCSICLRDASRSCDQNDIKRNWVVLPFLNVIGWLIRSNDRKEAKIFVRGNGSGKTQHWTS